VYSAITKETSEVTNTFGVMDIIVSVVGLYFVSAFFQAIIFACKTIAKVEYRREVSFSDYFDYFFLMICFVIGIWILQPKVNRLIAPKEEVAFE
jgi:nitrate reductase gamma subunit